MPVYGNINPTHTTPVGVGLREKLSNIIIHCLISIFFVSLQKIETKNGRIYKDFQRAWL
jgi:hypothetical protein